METKPVLRGKWLELKLDTQHAGKTIESILKEDLQLSGRMIQRLTRQKGLFLNRKAPYLQKKGREGDMLRVLIGDREEGVLTPENIPIDVVYEDDEVLVVNKQPGIIVHPIKPDQTGTLAHGIAYHWVQKGTKGKVRPVHRLDKDTSGLILIAKNSYIHQLLDKQLKDHMIQREYSTIVEGHLDEKSGTIKRPIGQDPSNPIKRKVSDKGEDAVTHYDMVEELPFSSYVRVALETGRTHQIRVHFQSVGHPIIGDTLYGSSHKGIKRQALHAGKLVFNHPLSGEKMEFIQELPEDMKSLLEDERKRKS